MGMTIEDIKAKLDKSNLDSDTLIELTRMMQSAYNARLKADLVSTLEDLDLQIDEFDSGCGWYGLIKKVEVHKLIQQKINVLKENTDDR